MTYSILAIDPEAGEIGVAVQSHFFAVGSCVPWAQAGVGVVASQSLVEPVYGVRGLSLMAQGCSPQQALESLLADDAGAPTRQVSMLSVSGAGATHTGTGCIGHAGHCVRQHSRTQANLVSSPSVWTAMAEEFEGASGSLAQRLIAALRAGEAQGGDLRGQQAAALRVVRIVATGDLSTDVVVDLRVDDADRPLDELDRLLTASQALSGLLRLLQTPGLLVGEFDVAEQTLTDALGELDRAQAIVGPGNGEPTVWKGLLLARAGRTDAARSCFVSAGRANPRAAELLRQLAAAGMWTRDPTELEKLLPP
ncbi:DUF1028 domain-containing protein [Pseudonocardia asaccharolytica]|uniref:DUF1028 domain-containing protein n=1 Tax=Pseudonocardia asaccharolytica DSM 44247 = NBRC 16224 TaxID=1123024 RepID=A0A511D5Y4_9PSEU|nr:DUF1028 domain-containing protein [Pseudonocardia asaccharolytica]GEL19873.1 hypothetical protein PA7_37100 [Pseudonocardia asaccharolytica DSM 44247 = NBRC 16224]